ncbi:glycosyltransferase [Vibrio mediterranei]|uniref:glycosyltransferase n=1 Tax=Vibrio mediterranei TaxID=689 RepID=UPI000F60A25B|nr:glycosyltransferase [Vibrio mediterranei]
MDNTDTIVVLSTADWNTKYLTNKQHTAREFAKAGFKVVYVESVGLRSPKVSSSLDLDRLMSRACSGLKTIMLGAKEVEKNIYVVSPLVSPFFKDTKVIKLFNSFLLNFLIKRVVRDERHIIWSYHPYIMNVVKKSNHEKLIYHCVDDLSSVPGINEEDFNSNEREFLRHCDHVFVTAPKLQERCESYNPNITYLSNVVDYEHFSRPLKHGDSNRVKKIIYHGVLSDFKLDLPLLAEIVNDNTQYEFILVGEEREGQSSPILEEISCSKNVKRLGYVAYSDLPEVLAQCDLGILPSQINDYTNSMFPMKFYEFIAAGLPIVSTRLHAISDIESDYVEKFASKVEFSVAAHKLLSKGKIPIKDRESLIGKNTWKERTSIMLKTIDESNK